MLRTQRLCQFIHRWITIIIIIVVHVVDAVMLTSLLSLASGIGQLQANSLVAVPKLSREQPTQRQINTMRPNEV